MSTPEALRRQFLEVLSRYQEALPTWPALTADAQGTLHVAGRPGWFHVRIGSDKIAAQAFNARVGDYVDYPVIVGYTAEQPNLFQVISARFVYAGADTGDDLLPQVPAHHRTHEFRRDGSGGGDTVWVQKQQMLPLQAAPTSLVSTMQVNIAADWYAWQDGWQYFAGATSADLSGYVPTGAAQAKFVLISVDGATNTLQYTEGDLFSTLLPPANLDDQLPAAPSGSVPVVAVYLLSTTTKLDWDNLYDIRLFNQPVGGSVLPAVHDHSEGAQGGQNLRSIQELEFADAVELTISSGAVTRTQVYHTIDTESDAASDDLDTINGGAEGDLLIIRAEDSARTVVVKTGTGNIVLSGGVDVTLDDDTDHLALIFNGTNWCDNSSGGGGAPTDAQYLALALDATLTDERRFVVGAGIDGADGGAGGDYTVTLADHDHSGDAGDGGKLDWDDVWNDAVHDHSSAAEGGVICHHVKATSNAGQNIPNETWTTLIFEDEEYDTNSEYVAATGVFTAKRSGKLLISTKILFGSTGTWAIGEILELRTSGSAGVYYTLDYQRSLSAATEYAGAQGTITLDVNTGETLAIQIYQSSGAALALIASGQHNWVCLDWLF